MRVVCNRHGQSVGDQARGAIPYSAKRSPRWNDNYHQIKTVAATGDDHIVHKQWEDDCRVDVVVYFARNSNWGVIAPAFTEDTRRLNHEGHRRFEQNKKGFLKEFHQFDHQTRPGCSHLAQERRRS
ncbi:MAG: hypothetical protein HN341_03015 [Verrucomicrobia bacterium]|jgi:hypothetical protein|nr:hypothetical protein [Verrucomicrobiota bacterium]